MQYDGLYRLTGCASPPIHSTVISAACPDPLFVLGVPRSFTSVITAMLGQHPQAYGLPETHLFSSENVSEWWDQCSTSTFPMADGLLRAVAELFCGGQTQEGIRDARGWLRRRMSWTTGMVLEALAEKLAPRLVVEKSPSIVYQIQSMQ